MLLQENFTEAHIRGFRAESKRDPLLFERTIYAFGLLEALARSGLPFVFKGGTCLMLLLEKPYRLSTDIDIISMMLRHCLMSLTILQRCAQPIERLLRHNARIEGYRSGMRFSSQIHFVRRFASHRIANLCVMNMNAMPMRFVR
ncbi:hypothetical protein AXF19_02830 [Selenomonas sp. oral taxon 126]|uniref:nucleotidyl transferase AbiEii/AbiGii toxin family protein n=1 Tax=Selenomonas sp. oral taxon 126 TaxID=712528 RepID=UPI00080792B5|nr:nucleotidyl transferase AbiEii/AbiGii toxin family protein [Selenomonas sp. oral taxon 126]ANR70029.1 hypothetical protein AXF19_02830 [Selenomonas sp. oral taxon 126]